MRSLPSSIREATPDHEALEERNEERIPPPADGDFHELLEEANEQYPDHSLAIMPSGQVHMGGGMMMHPVALLRVSPDLSFVNSVRHDVAITR